MKLLSPLEVRKIRSSEEDLVRGKMKELDASLLQKIKQINELTLNLEHIESIGKEREEKLNQDISLLEKKRIEIEHGASSERLKEREVVIKKKEKEMQERDAVLIERERQMEKMQAFTTKSSQDLQSRHEEIEGERKLLLEWKQEILDQNQDLSTKEKEFEWSRDAYEESKEFFQRMISKSWEEIQVCHRDLKLREKALSQERQEILSHIEIIKRERVALQDGYATLAKAREEILGRKT